MPMDLSNLAKKLAAPVRVYGCFLKLRERFIELDEHGIRLYPATVAESDALDSAIRTALYIYCNPREDSASAENYALAVLYVQNEVSAVRWLMDNMHYAQSLIHKAEKCR